MRAQEERFERKSRVLFPPFTCLSTRSTHPLSIKSSVGLEREVPMQRPQDSSAFFPSILPLVCDPSVGYLHSGVALAAGGGEASRKQQQEPRQKKYTLAFIFNPPRHFLAPHSNDRRSRSPVQSPFKHLPALGAPYLSQAGGTVEATAGGLGCCAFYALATAVSLSTYKPVGRS